MIVKQILLVSTLGNVRRTISRICILMLGCTLYRVVHILCQFFDSPVLLSSGYTLYSRQREADGLFCPGLVSRVVERKGKESKLLTRKERLIMRRGLGQHHWSRITWKELYYQSKVKIALYREKRRFSKQVLVHAYFFNRSVRYSIHGLHMRTLIIWQVQLSQTVTWFLKVREESGNS